MKPESARERIRELNDAFRQSFVGGQVMLTQGVAALRSGARTAVLTQVRTFDRFGSGNDPYGEHDFGSIEVNGMKFFWKMDYFDLTMNQHSVDPANAETTVRVLTIMCADEY